MDQLELTIRGTVQGVFYRQSTMEQAQSLNLMGWVCNHCDGSVRVLAQGPKDRLLALLQWCHHGPPAAQVDAIDTQWNTATQAHMTFAITADRTD